MTRTPARAKAAGRNLERAIADYLRDTLGQDIDRRVKTGAKDRGDITGLTIGGHRVVIEVKDYGGQVHVGEWLTEAAIEAANDGAPIGLVIFKRRGIAAPEQQSVLMTVTTLTRLINLSNTHKEPTGEPK